MIVSAEWIDCLQVVQENAIYQEKYKTLHKFRLRETIDPDCFEKLHQLSRLDQSVGHALALDFILLTKLNFFL